MKLRTFALTGVAIAALTGPALATEPGWYLGLAVGYDNLQNEKFTNPCCAPATLQFKDSGLYLVNGGYKWEFSEQTGVRAEFEFGYTKHVIKGSVPTAVPGPLAGGTENTSFMGNALYDIEIFPRWQLSIGGGVGYGSLNEYVRNSGHALPNSVTAGANGGFEWQGIAGVSFAVSPGLEMYTEYHFREIEADSSFRNSRVGSVHLSHTQENAAVLGLRWSFYEPPPPPPPPAPPPPPPPPPAAAPAPPPPPAVKTLVVFFDFDKANLTTEAQMVVADAVKAMNQGGFVRVMVTGHTDTVGSDRYNLALSLRRASAVKDEMVRQGVDASAISIKGRGFRDPLVQTGRGVREPRNRRAVIDLGA